MANSLKEIREKLEAHQTFHDAAYTYYYEHPKENEKIANNIIDQHNDKAQAFQELIQLIDDNIKNDKKLTKAAAKEKKEYFKNKYPKIFNQNLDQGGFEKAGNLFLYLLSFIVYPFSKKTSYALTNTKSENLFNEIEDVSEPDVPEDYVNKEILHTMKKERLNNNGNQQGKYGNDCTVGYYNGPNNKATFIDNEFRSSNNGTNNITCIDLLNQKNLSTQDHSTVKFNV